MRRVIALACLIAAVAVAGAVRPLATSDSSSPEPTQAAAPRAPAYPDPTVRVLTHREQNALVTPWIKKRFDTLLPGLMTREGIDMWIIPTREYNEDPVFASMSPMTYYSSRRRTILVLFNPGGGKPVERYSIGRFDYDRIFTLYPTHNDAQWEGLRKLVEEKQPKVIGINESDAWNHADGITANEKRRLMDALGATYASRVKSAEMLAVGWLELKMPEELEAYRHVMKTAHMVIREAFSNKVITPGKTTNEDVVWWMRQRVVELGLGKWFQPSVTIWRQGEKTNPQGVIQPGDMLHTDFGIVYLGFSTDTQHNAYVLKPGETDVPQGLKDGLKAGNRLQDLTMQFARLERTGNQALADALAQAKKEGLVPSIYCHPVGYHGHAAGPPIGMTDYQQGVPIRGDYVFRPNTWHSIELNVTHQVKEWGGQPVRFALEEDAALMPGGKWDWIDGRQESFYLIRP
jgi:Xaa-Pro aminopeptidase